MNPLSEKAVRVLDVLSSQGADGYTVMKQAGISAQDLIEALRELPPSLVTVKGEMIPDRIGDAYLVLPPRSKGYANLLVRSGGRATLA